MAGEYGLIPEVGVGWGSAGVMVVWVTVIDISFFGEGGGGSKLELVLRDGGCEGFILAAEYGLIPEVWRYSCCCCFEVDGDARYSCVGYCYRYIYGYRVLEGGGGDFKIWGWCLQGGGCNCKGLICGREVWVNTGSGAV